MQKYAKALEFLLEQQCEITIFLNLNRTYTVQADDGGRKAHGVHKQWRQALILAQKDFESYFGK